MAQSLNSKIDYKANMPKHVHDMTQSYAFTSSTGMELPIYYDMLHLGDEIHFSGNMFTRLNPLNVASLADIDIHLDYFFVPLTLMYTPSWSIFYQTDDLVSSMFDTGNVNQNSFFQSFPLLNVDSTLYTIRSTSSSGGVNGNQSKGGSTLSTSTGSGSSLFTFPNAVFDCVGKSAYRLCDAFQLSPEALFVSDSSVAYNPRITPWFLCAYQACHEFYFRNSDWEPRSYSYQLDNHYNASSFFTDIGLFRLNYVSAYKDYFNSLKVSPVGSSMSMIGGISYSNLLSQVNSYLFEGDYVRSGSTGSSTSGDGSSTTIRGLNSAGSASNSLTTANIRQLYMVDKMLRVTGRAKANYESQFLAHYGIKIPHDELHNITHIGHDSVTLHPSAVVSTADTFDGSSGSALGEIGGQGYVSLQGKKHTFKAPFHGVFMVIYHAQPRMRYYGGIDKLHQLSSPMDFWQPEYDRKGMQPLFSFETSRGIGNFSESSSQSRLGWQYGYEQFKRKYDRVSTAFRDTAFGVVNSGIVNTYNPWVLSARPYHTPSGLLKRTGQESGFDLAPNFISLLSTPHDLDNMMQIPYQSTWITDLTVHTAHLLFQTDPFIHDFRLDCKKVNMMSTYSEPEID